MLYTKIIILLIFSTLSLCIIHFNDEESRTSLLKNLEEAVVNWKDVNSTGLEIEEVQNRSRKVFLDVIDSSLGGRVLFTLARLPEGSEMYYFLDYMKNLGFFEPSMNEQIFRHT
ncbi:hypothetical protein Avbf_06361 [Armadillidium vulgare]|nr:hypothetical protein Avbf_06361 [Armadillidium vulgare]